jgi:tetratricopeptide (TPR) repeat protein
METAKPRAPLELSLVEIDPAPEDAANASSTGDPASLESVTLQPYSDRRPKPVAAPLPAAPTLGSLMLAPLDSPSTAPADTLSLAPLDLPSGADPLSLAPIDLATAAPVGTGVPATGPHSAEPGSIPLAASTTSGTSGTSPMGASTISGMSRFLQEAAREYEAGRIDQPLWMRAAAQAGGDETVARDNYLRARATALKLARREQRTDPAVRKGESSVASPAHIGANLAGRAIAGDDRHSATGTRKYIAIAASVGFMLAAAAWWFGGSDADPPPATVAAAKPGARPGATRTPAPPPAQEDHGRYFGGKIQELKNAGNWNVLVLYASEWTRKQPDSAAAWKELAIGYSNMRQAEDALQAAGRATQLAPKDPAAWRLLAQVNVELDQPAAALEAFETAAALDEGDLTSWVQAGNLSTQLDRLPEAHAAFDKVLAVNPEHVGALCGKAQLAQKSRQPKEAEAITRQLKAVDGRCRDVDATVAITPAASSPMGTAGASAAYKPAATSRAR